MIDYDQFEALANANGLTPSRALMCFARGIHDAAIANAAESKLPLNKKLLGFFQRNPDDELSVEDICEKFGVTESTARHIARPLISSGAITKRWDKSMRANLYKLADNHKEPT